jgi:hypothetical protein
MRPVHVRFKVEKMEEGYVSFSEYFSFPLSVSFHHGFVLIILSEGQRGEDWEPSNIAVRFLM